MVAPSEISRNAPVFIHPSAWKRNSAKFAVASNQSNVAVSTLQRYSGTP
jgi:hypothetical protein